MSVSFDSSDRSGSGTTISTAASTLAPDQTPVRPAGTHRHVALSDLRLLRRIGSGDIGSVYLSELQTAEGGRRTIAAKVMDRRELEERGKEGRARTEREVLGMLDHPFLPALLGVAEDDTWTCLLTEFCNGGDLHVLRQRQQGRRFPEDAVRFYASEIVAALEYLHMLGIVYRDLKPENVLIRSDGHIMLTDFDLSLRSEGDASPAVRLVPDASVAPGTASSLGVPPFIGSSCVPPRCIMPAVSCFHPKKSKRRRRSSRRHNAGGLEFVAEPVDLRSMSFVGTHEYLAPEIVSGEGHGSAVDWWTLGIFIYELLYSTTPFKGSDNDLTLANIVARALEFPKDPPVSSNSKDLIARLLAKDPSKRIGSTMGASAIKRHPFFKGVNWALLRCALPPYIPPPLSRCCSSLDVSEDDGGPDSPVEYY